MKRLFSLAVALFLMGGSAMAADERAGAVRAEKKIKWFKVTYTYWIRDTVMGKRDRYRVTLVPKLKPANGVGEVSFFSSHEIIYSNQTFSKSYRIPAQLAGRLDFKLVRRNLRTGFVGGEYDSENRKSFFPLQSVDMFSSTRFRGNSLISNSVRSTGRRNVFGDGDNVINTPNPDELKVAVSPEFYESDDEARRLEARLADESMSLAEALGVPDAFTREYFPYENLARQAIRLDVSLISLGKRDARLSMIPACAHEPSALDHGQSVALSYDKTLLCSPNGSYALKSGNFEGGFLGLRHAPDISSWSRYSGRQINRWYQGADSDELVKTGTLTLQTDCNLVLSDASGNPKWHSNTARTPEPGARCRLTLQEDGNLVLYREVVGHLPVAVWNTDGGDFLVEAR